MLAYPLAAVLVLQTVAAVPHPGPKYVKPCDPCTIMLLEGNPPADFRFELETVPQGRVVKAIVFERSGHPVQRLDVRSMTPIAEDESFFLEDRISILTAGSTCYL